MVDERHVLMKRKGSMRMRKRYLDIMKAEKKIYRKVEHARKIYNIKVIFT